MKWPPLLIFPSIEYEKNSEMSQLTEEDCLRSDAKKLSPIKNLNCIMNEVNKLTTHFQNVDKDAFFSRYGRLMEIERVEVLSTAVRVLVHLKIQTTSVFLLKA
jgi:ribosomal protein S15P/S13E